MQRDTLQPDHLLPSQAEGNGKRGVATCKNPPLVSTCTIFVETKTSDPPGVDQANGRERMFQESLQIPASRQGLAQFDSHS